MNLSSRMAAIEPEASSTHLKTQPGQLLGTLVAHPSFRWVQPSTARWLGTMFFPLCFKMFRVGKSRKNTEEIGRPGLLSVFSQRQSQSGCWETSLFIIVVVLRLFMQPQYWNMICIEHFEDQHAFSCGHGARSATRDSRVCLYFFFSLIIGFVLPW